MPIVDYPFQAQGVFSQLSPILPIKIINPRNGLEFQTWGLVDTGSDATIITGYIANKIGLNIDSVQSSPGEGAGGSFDVFEVACSINILSMDEDGNVNINDVVIEIRHRRIGVIRDLRYVLLGVNDFLKKYVLTIDYSREIFSICRPRPPQHKKKIKHRRR